MGRPDSRASSVQDSQPVGQRFQQSWSPSSEPALTSLLKPAISTKISSAYTTRPVKATSQRISSVRVGLSWQRCWRATTTTLSTSSRSTRCSSLFQTSRPSLPRARTCQKLWECWSVTSMYRGVSSPVDWTSMIRLLSRITWLSRDMIKSTSQVIKSGLLLISAHHPSYQEPLSKISTPLPFRGRSSLKCWIRKSSRRP